MKTLTSNEIQHVSGGEGAITAAIGILSITNFALTMSLISTYSDAFESMLKVVLYHEVQLSTLPNYDEIREDPTIANQIDYLVAN